MDSTTRGLEARALQLRIDSIRCTSKARSGHPSSCLSAADLVSTLFFHVVKVWFHLGGNSLSPGLKQIDLKNPNAVNNDHFVLSKGHAAPILYAVFKQLGVICDNELLKLRKFGSRLVPSRVYVLMGDGEYAEGSVWEAAGIAAARNLDNITLIVDANKFGQSGPSLHQHDLTAIAGKFSAFGWHTICIDGHNFREILRAFEEALQQKGKPSVIIAKTVKGYPFKEQQHGKPYPASEVDVLVEQLKEQYISAEAVTLSPTFHMAAALPESVSLDRSPSIKVNLGTSSLKDEFLPNKVISTRKAFGLALSALAAASPQVIALDADVKNSTYVEIVEKAHSNQVVECYIAEQNMVSMAIGLSIVGFIPFAATFGCFLTRAFDQIRMAGVGSNPIRIAGSHCGVSIGEDGPSQMALEDISMFRSIPNSVVVYPADGVAAFKLTECIANNHDGVSYIRLSRQDSTIIYSTEDEFHIGGSKIIRSSEADQCCIIACGITLFEALKAAELLSSTNINCCVIDAYSVKPLDEATILATASRCKRLVTVEDHYEAGGLGEAISTLLSNKCETKVQVQTLCVRSVPSSGSPEELRSWARIDSRSIAASVLALIR
ncbi:Transketolase 2 [Pelomyxa schiedti]|nr:Transketolase 2 [Pelomyxa schiedti]